LQYLFLICNKTSLNSYWLFLKKEYIIDVLDDNIFIATTPKRRCQGEKVMGKTMIKKMLVVLLLLVFLFTSGCATMSRREGGAIIGGAAGAGIGQLIALSPEATLIGLLIGAILGAIIGNEMDEMDRQNVNHAYEEKPDNQTHDWINPNNGNKFSVTPTSTDTLQGQPCRMATIESIIDGNHEQVSSQACRNAKGVWELR